MGSSPCAKHPHQPNKVGVCAACLREKLALCMQMSSLEETGAEGTNNGSNEGSASPIDAWEGYGEDSPAFRDVHERRTLSDYVGDMQASSAHCHHAQARTEWSSGGASYEGNSFYAAPHHYVAKGGGERGSFRPPSCTQHNPTLSSRFNGAAPFPCLSALLLPRREVQQREDPKEGSIVPCRLCCRRRISGSVYDQQDSTCTNSFPSEGPSSAASQSPSLLSSQSAKSLLRLSPMMPAFPPLFSQSTKSSSKLQPSRSSPRSLPPLLSYPRSPLNLPCRRSPKSSRTWSDKLQTNIVSPQIEENRRGVRHGNPFKKGTWFGVFLRSKWVLRFKRHFARKQNQDDAKFVRTSSGRKSDFCRHSLSHCSVQAHGHCQNHYFMEKDHLRSPILNRSLRAGRSGAEQHWPRGGGRDSGGSSLL